MHLIRQYNIILSLCIIECIYTKNTIYYIMKKFTLKSYSTIDNFLLVCYILYRKIDEYTTPI